MYIKNKKTQIVTECLNADVIKVCKKDTENYEVWETLPVESSDDADDTDPSETADMSEPEKVKTGRKKSE